MRKKLNVVEPTMADMVERAKRGDKNALEEIVRRVQDNVYGLAVRMLFVPADAEDATQEILVKVITNLGTFKGESRFETWVYRIASNHLLTTRKCRAERWKLTFETCEQMIEEGTREAGEQSFTEAEDNLIVEETRRACVQHLLLCLTRELRLAVILGLTPAAMLIRNHPDYEAPGVFVASMKKLIESGRFQLLGR